MAEGSSAPSQAMSPLWGSERLGVALLCAVGLGTINCGRSLMSVAILPMGEAMGWTAAAVGTVQSAYFLGYPLLQMWGGKLADDIGPRKVLAVFAVLWSLTMLLLPQLTLAAGVRGAYAARVLFGVASGVGLPVAHAMLGAFFPAHEKSTGVCFVFTGFHVGAVIGLAMTPVVMNAAVSALGWAPAAAWHAPFYALGIAGLLFSVAWSLAVPDRPREPVPVRRVSAGDAGPAPESPTFLEMMVNPKVLGLIWMHSVYNILFFTLLSWTPTYLRKQLGVSLANAGAAGALPFLVMAIVGMGAGLVADVMMRDWGWSTLSVRRLLVFGSTLAPCASLAFLGTTASPALAVLSLVVAMGTLAFSQAGFHGYIQDVAPASSGSVMGCTNMVSGFFGMLATWLTGYIVEATGSFQAVFWTMSLVALTGALVFHRIADGRVLTFPHTR